MSENRKFPHSSRIWDNASHARDIQLALMFELAATAFTEGWEALRLRIRRPRKPANPIVKLQRRPPKTRRTRAESWTEGPRGSYGTYAPY